MKMPSLNGPKSEGKFPTIGDEGIVGPMEQIPSLAQQPHRKKRKLGLLRWMQGVWPAGAGVLGRRSSSGPWWQFNTTWYLLTCTPPSTTHNEHHDIYDLYRRIRDILDSQYTHHDPSRHSLRISYDSHLYLRLFGLLLEALKRLWQASQHNYNLIPLGLGGWVLERRVFVWN